MCIVLLYIKHLFQVRGLFLWMILLTACSGGVLEISIYINIYFAILYLNLYRNLYFRTPSSAVCNIDPGFCYETNYGGNLSREGPGSVQTQGNHGSPLMGGLT